MRTVFLILFFASVGFVSWRLAPVITENETYRSSFPSALFRAKLEKGTPEWMSQQIGQDFAMVPDISSEALVSSYWEIRKKIGEKNICHYRILDNKLYKFIANRREYKSRDTYFEKAIKTLLLQTKVPNVDFLFCGMDGIPEPYVPQDFFLTKKKSPIFGQAKIKGSPYIILIPDQVSLSKDWMLIANEILSMNEDIPWKKKEERALWRGGLTDIGLPHEVEPSTLIEFTNSPRFFIAKLSNQFPSSVDAGINWIWKEADKALPLFKKANILKDYCTKREHLLHKYLPVLDGHMCTYPGYQWRLLSNSAAFKQDSNQIQWFYAALEPYSHFVPIRNDLADLLEKIEWAKGHDSEIQKIVAKAQDFAHNHLMMEDNYLYLFRALQHYASLQKIDFEKVKSSMENHPKWVCIQYRKRLKFQRTFQRIFFSFSKSAVEEE